LESLGSYRIKLGIPLQVLIFTGMSE